MSIVLCVLCLLLCIVALFFRWIQIAIIMAGFALIQAYMICIWRGRKRRSNRQFNPKRRKQE